MALRYAIAVDLDSQGYVRGVRLMEQAGPRATKSIGGMRSALGGLQGALASVGLGLFVREIAQAQLQIDRIRGSLRQATGSTAAAGVEIAFLRGEAARLGIVFEDAALAYGKLAAAARGTALGTADLRELFLGVSEAGAALSLSGDQVAGALTAVEQIISKGKVSAEELRGQLGERIPGAFQIAARAMGKTTAELDKMLSQGLLPMEEFLPQFAAELRKTFGAEAENAADNFQGALNRSKNAAFDLRVQVAEGLTPAIAALATQLSDLAGSEEAGLFARDVGVAMGAIVNFVGMVADKLDDFGVRWTTLRATVAKAMADIVEGVGNGSAAVVDFLADVWDKAPAHPLSVGRKLLEGFGVEVRSIEEMRAEAAKLRRDAGFLAASLRETADELLEMGAGSESAAGGVVALDRSIIPATVNVKQLEDALRAQIEALKETSAPLVKMRDELAALEGQLAAAELAATAEDLERIALAVEMGLDPMQAINGEWKTYLSRVQAVRRALEEAEQAVRDYSAAAGKARELGDLPTTGEEGGPPAFEFDVILPTDEVLDQLGRDLAQYRRTKWAAEWERMATTVADAFGPAFDSISDGLGDLVNQAIQLVHIFKSLPKGKGFSAAGAAGGAAFGAGVGDLMKGLGLVQGQRGQGGFGGELSGDYGDIGATVGGVIGSFFGPIGTAIGALLGGIIGGAIKSGADEGLATLEMVGDEVATRIMRDQGGLGKVIGGVAEDVMDTIQGILDILGGELVKLPTIQLKVRDDVISVFVNGLVGRFKDMGEAIDFAVTQALRTAEISGIGPAVKAALEDASRGMFKDLEDLQESLSIAFELDNLGIPQAAREIDAALDQVANRFDQFVESASEWGQSLETMTAVGIDFGAGWQAVRDQITGVTKSERQIFEERSAMFDARLASEKARLVAERAGIAVQLEMMKARAQLVDTGIQLDGILLEGLGHLVNGMGALAQHAAAMVPVLEAQLAALDAALAELDKIKPIDPKEFRPRGGGGGFDQVAQDLESLRQLLDEALLAQLPEFEQALARINQKWEEALEKAHGNADLIAEITAAREAEIAALEKQRLLNFTDALADFLGGGGSGSSFVDAVAAVDQRVNELGGDLGQLAEDLGLTAFEMLHFWQQALAGAEHMREALARQGFQDLARGLADLVQDEELRHDLLMQAATIEFDLRMAQYQLEFDLLQTLGYLTAEQMALLEEGLDNVAAHRDDIIRGMVPVPGGGGGGGGPDPADERARALARLRDIQARMLSPFEQAIRSVVDEFAELRRVLGWTAEVQAAYAQEIQRVLMEQLEPIRRLQEELAFHEGSPLRSIDQFRLAQQRLNEAVAALAGGDLAQLENIPDLARMVLDLNPSSQASEATRFLFARIQSILDEAAAAAAQAVEGIEPGAASDPFAELRDQPTAGDILIAQTIRDIGRDLGDKQDDTTTNTAGTRDRLPIDWDKVMVRPLPPEPPDEAPRRIAAEQREVEALQRLREIAASNASIDKAIRAAGPGVRAAG